MTQYRWVGVPIQAVLVGYRDPGLHKLCHFFVSCLAFCQPDFFIAIGHFFPLKGRFKTHFVLFYMPARSCSKSRVLFVFFDLFATLEVTLAHSRIRRAEPQAATVVWIDVKRPPKRVSGVAGEDIDVCGGGVAQTGYLFQSFGFNPCGLS